MRCALYPFAGCSCAAVLLFLLGCLSAGPLGDLTSVVPVRSEEGQKAPSDRAKQVTRPTREDELIQTVLTATLPSEAKDGYRKLFKHVGHRGLKRLQSHTSDTIAVQAAWMQVELTVPAKEPAREVRPDSEKLAEFLGLLEKRSPVKVPKWWSDAILSAGAHRRGNIYSGRPHPFELWKAKEPIPENWLAKATIDRREGKLVVQLGKEFETLPEGFYEKVKKPITDTVRVLFSPQRCYVAIHDDFGYGYRLGCFDRGTLKTRWVSDVWGSWWYAASGACWQLVEIVEQGDRVAVFGDACGFHAEVFRVDDGANILRFSNSYTPD